MKFLTIQFILVTYDLVHDLASREANHEIFKSIKLESGDMVSQLDKSRNISRKPIFGFKTQDTHSITHVVIN